MALNIRPRVSAVSYLNTSPLVWGLLHGAQVGQFELRFELPRQCAESVRTGTVEIGLVPVIEVDRQGLERVPGLGIASEGLVRSILLISKRPLPDIRSLALDTSSRTSVVLARIILAERFGVQPELRSLPPDVRGMLDQADCALVIGDPALQFDISDPQLHVCDLGAEWTSLTGLPMIYAVWAGRDRKIVMGAQECFQASYEFGRQRIPEIVREEGARRGISAGLATEYLSRHITYQLDDNHYAGLRQFLDLARRLV